LPGEYSKLEYAKSHFNILEMKKETSMTLNCWQLKGWKPEGWTVCAIALLSFAAGSLVTAQAGTASAFN
jgi:hypothetical protein